MKHSDLRTYGMTDVASASVVVGARVFLTTHAVLTAALISATLILTSSHWLAVCIWGLVLGALSAFALRNTIVSVKGAFDET